MAPVLHCMIDSDASLVRPEALQRWRYPLAKKDYRKGCPGEKRRLPVSRFYVVIPGAMSNLANPAGQAQATGFG
jgi:hypothetical protein